MPLLILNYSLTKKSNLKKSNLEAQQHRFLASPANNRSMQPQKPSYTATGSFRKPRQPIKSLRPKQNHPYRSENQPQSSMSNTRTDFPKVILSLPLIQEGQLSVSGERMCTILVNRLEN